jgi:hypothetical protein
MGDDQWNVGVTITAGVMLGFVLGAAFCSAFRIIDPTVTVGDPLRTGFVKFLFDWQQLIVGVAAALAAWLLLWQLADTRRQATAAEFQARIANAAFIGDRIAKLRRAVRLSLELRDQLSRLHPSLVKLGPFFLMLLDHQRPIGTETAEFLTLKSVIDELKTKADAFRDGADAAGLSGSSWKLATEVSGAREQVEILIPFTTRILDAIVKFGPQGGPAALAYRPELYEGLLRGQLQDAVWNAITLAEAFRQP